MARAQEKTPAARAERRAPGFLERALAADARGRQMLGSLAVAVVASSAAAPFLRHSEAGLDAPAFLRGFPIPPGTKLPCPAIS